jgi:benzoyl-CoA reductase/2-hydroxyglutaryl-CoA dehydratase subunit BcrC/BadD/HgdB
MRVLNFPTQCRSRYRFILPPLFIFLLCTFFFYYHSVPSFAFATDNVLSTVTTTFRQQTGFCTKGVGNRRCCHYYLEAAPCLDECRKEHVNRTTFELTKEYENCSDGCLLRYNRACQPGEKWMKEMRELREMRG